METRNDLVYCLLVCSLCGKHYAVIPMAHEQWAVWPADGVVEGIGPQMEASARPFCFEPSCRGEFTMEIDLAVLTAGGKWITVGKNDPVLAENVLMN